MNLLTRLDRKYGRYAIKNVMLYMIIGYLITWFIIQFNLQFFLTYLTPDISMILKGQVWRIITIIFLPPSYSDVLLLAINLYFLYFIGRIMEDTWGSFALNLFFAVGIILHIVGAFILYGVFHINIGNIEGILGGGMIFGSYYLTMALFMLVGMSAPDMHVLLFFIIPVKMKWMAVFTLAILGGTVLFGYGNALGVFENASFMSGLIQVGIYPTVIPATSALMSLIMFFGFYYLMKSYHISRAQKTRKKNFEQKIKIVDKPKVHKCAVCGRTSEDETLSFRFCSKCNGTYEYCQDHLFTHEHKK